MARSLVVAGLRGDSGKTLVSLSIALGVRARGIDVRAFKKGPDYIDAAWLGWATGGPCRNLDTFLMGDAGAASSFARHASGSGLNLIEGNRGLFDGVDWQGTHSTAALARLLGAPVLLVVDVSKVTRTAAALALGAREFDPGIRIAGIILNRVAGSRHERVVRQALESTGGPPIMGAVPRLTGPDLLPARHLGLTPPAEHGGLDTLRGEILDRLVPCLDLEALLGMNGVASLPAQRAASFASDASRARRPSGTGASHGRVVIGFAQDLAFSFYYPDNLEALEAEGAALTPVSAMHAASVPEEIDALYIGGGFPETYAAEIAGNRGFLGSLADGVRSGLPVFAECGGLLLLSRSISSGGRRHEMAGILPFDVSMEASPQGHGYVELVIDRANPFFAVGTRIAGHEFHYSRIARVGGAIDTAARVSKGTGVGGGRDAVVCRSVWASYTHLHAIGCPEWAPAVVRAARGYRAARR
ncbi:MAG: cobyrinate a,c-diamide synthase [Vicinamibacterales bacterium]